MPNIISSKATHLFTPCYLTQPRRPTTSPILRIRRLNINSLLSLRISIQRASLHNIVVLKLRTAAVLVQRCRAVTTKCDSNVQFGVTLVRLDVCFEVYRSICDCQRLLGHEKVDGERCARDLLAGETVAYDLGPVGLHFFYSEDMISLTFIAGSAVYS